MDKLPEILKNNIVIVTFTKINGDIRKMSCTLDPKYIKNNIESVERNTSNNTIKVWSIDDNDWRSFRPESVIAYAYIEGSQ